MGGLFGPIPHHHGPPRPSRGRSAPGRREVRHRADQRMILRRALTAAGVSALVIAFPCGAAAQAPARTATASLRGGVTITKASVQATSRELAATVPREDAVASPDTAQWFQRAAFVVRQLTTQSPVMLELPSLSTFAITDGGDS